MANEIKEWFTSHQGCMGLVPLPKSGDIRPMVIGEPADPGYLMAMVRVITKKGTERDMPIPIKHLMGSGQWYIPQCKMWNGVQAAGYFRIDPLRQYAKGLKEVNSRWLNGGVPYSSSFSIRCELGWNYNKPYPPFDEAFGKVMQGDMLSCAFDRYWAIGALNRSPVPVLYHREDAVGRFDLDTDTVILPKSYQPFNEFITNLTHRKVVNE